MSPKNPQEKDLVSTAFSMKGELQSSLGKVTKNPAEAQDLLQSLLERLIARTDREVQDPEHYIRRSARNLGIDWLRAHRASNQIVSIENDDGLGIVDPRSGPEDLAAARQELQIIMGALPPKCAEVFYQVQIEGYTYAEVAEQLQISTATVKSHLQHAALVVARLYNKPSA